MDKENLNAWAVDALKINRLARIIPRKLAAGDAATAELFAARAKKLAWKMLKQMVAAGAAPPVGYKDEEPAAKG